MVDDLNVLLYSYKKISSFCVSIYILFGRGADAFVPESLANMTFSGTCYNKFIQLTQPRVKLLGGFQLLEVEELV